MSRTSGVDMTAGEFSEVQMPGVPIPPEAVNHANEKGVEQMPLFSTQPIEDPENDPVLL